MRILRCAAVIMGLITALGTAGAVCGVFALSAVYIKREGIEFPDRHIYVICSFLAVVCAIILLAMVCGALGCSRECRMANIFLECVFLLLWIVVILFLIGKDPLAYRVVEQVWEKEDYNAGMWRLEEQLECCGWEELRDNCTAGNVTCRETFDDLMGSHVIAIGAGLFAIVVFIMITAIIQLICLLQLDRRVGNAGGGGVRGGGQPGKGGGRTENSASVLL
jgi:hypothetical protein